MLEGNSRKNFRAKKDFKTNVKRLVKTSVLAAASYEVIGRWDVATCSLAVHRRFTSETSVNFTRNETSLNFYQLHIATLWKTVISLKRLVRVLAKIYLRYPMKNIYVAAV
jgi:hypothetical protein